MNLINEKVQHKVFGIGTVIACDEKYITIEFQTKKSKFPYPEAFDKFIAALDPTVAELINAEMRAVKAAKEAKKAEEAAKKVVEEERRLEILKRQEIKKTVKKSSAQKKNNVVKRAPGKVLTYLVFQGDTYDEECRGQFIWAPKYTKSGGTCHHWDRLMELQRGDIIFHCSNGYIRAISIVKEHCVDSKRPGDWDQWEKDGRRVDCNYHVLKRPLKHGDYKDKIVEYCNIKYFPFDKDGNGNMGYLFELNRELAIFFVEEASRCNDYLFTVLELSWMLCDTPTIASLDDLRNNCETIDKYLDSKKDPEYSFALELIKQSTCFVAMKKEGVYRFYPSRFVGYKENSMVKHENNGEKDGRETNSIIESLLGAGKPIPNAKLGEAYKEYCKLLGLEPRDKGSFGVEHKFWEIYEW